MLWTKIKVVTLVLLAVGLVGVGAGISFNQSWLGGPSVAAGEVPTQPVGKPKETTPTTLSDLIQQLGDPQFAQRERASKALYEIGQPAVEPLRKEAVASANAEIRKRSKDLINSIESPTYGEICRFEGHTALVYTVAFSATNPQILTSSYDKTLRLWDCKSGKEVRQITAHEVEYGALCADFAPDGRHALSGSADGSVRLWNLETGKEMKKFMKHRGTVLRVAFSRDGKYALSASHDKTARLWDLEAGREERCFEGHTDALWQGVLSPDGKRVLTGSVDHTLRVWDRTTGKELRRIVVPRVVNMCVAFSPDGSRFASGGSDNLIHLWDAETGKEERTLNGHTAPVTAIAFSLDGRRALSGSHDKTVRLWDVKTGTELRRFRGHTNMVYAVAISPDGSLALSGGEDRTARLWKLPAKDAPIQASVGRGVANKSVEQPIAGLIQQLGDDRFEKREAATRKLESLGEAALAALRAAAMSSEHFEIRRRSESLIQAIAGRVARREFAKLAGTWKYEKKDQRGNGFVVRMFFEVDGKGTVPTFPFFSVPFDSNPFVACRLELKGKEVFTTIQVPGEKTKWTFTLSEDKKTLIMEVVEGRPNQRITWTSDTIR